MAWYMVALSKYATFFGRSRRKEYWWFLIVNCIVLVILSMIDGLFGFLTFGHVTELFSGIYGIAIFVPSMAVLVRRLHDTGHTGIWALASFVPILGWLVILLFTLQDSEEGINEYGANPKWVMD